ncbi:LysM peptidoglycan-binding domain-containing protein [Oryzobacter terrae]|uniref:LysM peptidoglycan-binding domain-containing protein n=1 Tax=Oryzobacter terrae TaxID=1620385 RepID=UPI00366C810C
MQIASNTIKRLFISLRPAVAVVGGVALTLALARVTADLAGRLAAGVPVRADELLVMVVAGAAGAVSAWLATVVAVSALTGVPGVVGRVAGGLAELVAPAALRRVVAVSLGLTVAAGAVPGGSVAAAPRGPAVVAIERPGPSFRPLPDPGWSSPGLGRPARDLGRHQPDLGTSGVGGGADDVVPDPGWVPTAPVVRPQPDLRVLAPTRPAPTHQVAEVVVRRGDTLWSIAARRLGADASEAEVAAAWPRWFAANRDVVGADPDLLLPGQVLRAPEAAAS